MKKETETLETAEPVQTESAQTAETAEAESAKKPNKFVSAFDKFFKFRERGSSMSREIRAGLSAFFISAVIVFLNVAIIGQKTFNVSASEGTGYLAGLFFVTMLTSFAGTLAIGLICNLPLVQSAGLGLGSSAIALAGGEGLTFYNILAVSFISAAVFTIVCATPVKKYLYRAIPASVRKAIPIAVGVFILVMFLNLAAGGDISLGGSIRNIFSTAAYSTSKAGIVSIIAIACTLVCGMLLKMLGKKSVFKISLLVGTVIYFLFGCILDFNNVVMGGSNYDRFLLIVDSDGGYSSSAIANAGSYNFFKVFTEGFDFSAYTAAGGNTAILFLTGILSFLMLGCYENAGNVHAALAHGDMEVNDKKFGTALLVAGGTGVVASMFGAVPTSVSCASSAATDDGGRTGLTSVVCAIGQFVCIFTWLIFAIFATTTGTAVNYGHGEYSVYVQATFQVVYAATALVGFSLVLKGVKGLKLEDNSEAVTVVAAVLATALSANITVGIAIGILADMFTKLLTKRWKKITVSELVIGILLLLTLIFGVFF